MKPLCLIPTLGLAVLLAACGEKAENNAATPADTATAEASDTMAGMGNMEMPAAGTAKGAGTVRAIDKAAGTITLEHGPIPEANWPAMTMAFKAAPGLLDSVQIGDRVTFDLKLGDNAGEVTAIAKQ